MNELLNRKDRKARKDHKCSLCNEIIRKGEIYTWSKNIYDGTIYEWHEHKKCSNICAAIWDYVDLDEGMSDQEFQDGCAEVCQCFICPECPKYDNDIGECDNDVTYCLDKLHEFFQKHQLYMDGRNRYGGECWKVKEIHCFG